MKYSIRKKMFLISMATTIVSFLLILLFFNLICRQYIAKESISELHVAAASARSAAVSYTLRDSSDIVPSSVGVNVQTSPASFQILYKEGTEPSVLAAEVQKSMDRKAPGVNFLILDNARTVYPAVLDAVPFEQVLPPSHYDELAAVQNYAAAEALESATRATINNKSYYLLSTPLGDDATAVFYKNVQPLDDLVTNVNTALFILLFACAVISIAAYMGLSNGMVRSIQKLCGFAEEVGGGNFSQQPLNLKEKELSVLADDMNQMACRLSAYDTEQKTFFQNVSHELRTPLMSIQGYAEGISAGVFERTQSVEAAGIILAESERLAAMVDDLLYLSRIDSAAENRGKNSAASDEFDCLPVLSDIAERAAVLAPEIKIIFENPSNAGRGVPDPIQDTASFLIRGSRLEFEKALYNILSNGLRYASSQVTITCDSNAGTIRIADDGPGIAEADLPHIFKRFYIGEGGCTGIGLAISQAVIEKMGGVITVESLFVKGSDDPNQEPETAGTAFTIKLPSGSKPLRRRTSPAAQPAPPGTAP